MIPPETREFLEKKIGEQGDVKECLNKLPNCINHCINKPRDCLNSNKRD